MTLTDAVYDPTTALVDEFYAAEFLAALDYRQSDLA